jgi:hypothetical protein
VWGCNTTKGKATCSATEQQFSSHGLHIKCNWLSCLARLYSWSVLPVSHDLCCHLSHMSHEIACCRGRISLSHAIHKYSTIIYDKMRKYQIPSVYIWNLSKHMGSKNPSCEVYNSAMFAIGFIVVLLIPSLQVQ